jgi:hypothetical protein
MKRAVKTLFCLSAMLPAAAYAQIIMCKDANGKTHTSDRPIIECADRPIREFGSSGYLRREIPAPLTAEQKRQKQLEDEKRRAEEIALLEQKQADRALLARYRSEDDIEIARKRALDVVQDHFVRQTEAIAAAEKLQRDAQSDMVRLKNRNEVPPALQQRLEESDKKVRDEKSKRQSYAEAMVNINAQFDATLQRYRELNNRHSTASK